VIDRALVARRVADWRGILRRGPVLARQILRKVFSGVRPLALTPAEGGAVAFTGSAAGASILAGLAQRHYGGAPGEIRWALECASARRRAPAGSLAPLLPEGTLELEERRLDLLARYRLAVDLRMRDDRVEEGEHSLSAGRRTRKMAPSSAAFSAEIRPPWASMIERLIARPMPSPSAFVVKKGSNLRCRSLSGDPRAGIAHGQLRHIRPSDRSRCSADGSAACPRGRRNRCRRWRAVGLMAWNAAVRTRPGLRARGRGT
jgi:hypothetical protein